MVIMRDYLAMCVSLKFIFMSHKPVIAPLISICVDLTLQTVKNDTYFGIISEYRPKNKFGHVYLAQVCE